MKEFPRSPQYGGSALIDRLRRVTVATAIVLFGVASSARADIIIVAGGIPGNPDENILFNDPGLTTTGLTVEGITNTTGVIFTLTENSEQVSTPSNGQARVAAADGGAYNYLLIQPQDPSLVFEQLEANVNLNLPGNDTTNIRITATGSETKILNFTGGPGQNFFNVYVILSQYVSSVLIETTSGDFIEDVRQVRVGGVQSQPESQVSEPVSLLLLGGGLSAAAALARRRRKFVN